MQLRSALLIADLPSGRVTTDLGHRRHIAGERHLIVDGFGNIRVETLADWDGDLPRHNPHAVWIRVPAEAPWGHAYSPVTSLGRVVEG